MDRIDDHYSEPELGSEREAERTQSDALFWLGAFGGFLIIGIAYFWLHQGGIG
jgi:hypothetical protein